QRERSPERQVAVVEGDATGTLQFGVDGELVEITARVLKLEGVVARGEVQTLEERECRATAGRHLGEVACEGERATRGIFEVVDAAVAPDAERQVLNGDLARDVDVVGDDVNVEHVRRTAEG